MKKFLIIIYIIIFVALAYYVINLFIDRTQENNQVEIESQTKLKDEVHTDAMPPTIAELETEEMSNEQQDARYTITREDCDNECANKIISEEKSYCNQICGFINITSDETCDELSGPDKDYCISNQAVAKKDLQKCTEIKDSGIKKQCQNRINEDFIDEIM